MEMDLIRGLKELTKSKNDSYSIIAKYLLIEENIERLKIKDLKVFCHVSSTTVVRFCKALGLDGFPELKYRLVQERKENEKRLSIENFVLAEKANEHLESINKSFSRTRNILSDKKLELTVEYLKTANQINIYGVGITYLVAQDLEFKLERVKKYCKSYNDKSLQYFSAKNSDENTVAIGITYSGTSSSVIESLRITKEQGGRTILITNESNLQFDDEFDIILYVSSSEKRDRLITTTSRLSILYLVDLIYYSYINTNADEFKNILIYSSNS